MIVLMKRPDFNLVAHKGQTQGDVGLATTTKVIYVSEDAVDDEKLVAHELLHTIPRSKWPPGTDGNDPACGVLYHNQAAGVAHGIKVRDRLRMDGVLPLLGPDASSPTDSTWITQCSYWHLLNNLDLLVDPPVLLVSGYVLRDDGATFGIFTPFYELDGVVGLEAGSGGDWAVVLRDGAGAQLERFPFEPQWQAADLDEETDVVGFAFELPLLPGLAEVELVGPSGQLDTRVRSASPPNAAIALPASEGDLVPLGLEGRAMIDWSATDTDGGALRYAVLYSADGGQSWVDVALDRPQSAIGVPFDPAGTAHRVRVLVSDGGRSTAVETGFVPATSTVEIFGEAEGGTVELDVEGQVLVVVTTAGEAGASVAASIAAAINGDAVLGAGGIVGRSYGRLAFSNGVISSVSVLDPGLSLDPDLFADGFESGDTAAWGATVP
jgi:hypothetical protein